MQLAELLGSKTAEKIFLYLYHYPEGHARGIAKDMKMGFGQVERQLKRYEDIDLLISRLVGKTRVYLFNPRYVFHTQMKDMIAKLYNSLPIADKKLLFPARQKPRKRDKPVIGR
jgi:hypothetical protein